jgi:hypothetical protein
MRAFATVQNSITKRPAKDLPATCYYYAQAFKSSTNVDSVAMLNFTKYGVSGFETFKSLKKLLQRYSAARRSRTSSRPVCWLSGTPERFGTRLFAGHSLHT